MAKAVAQQQAPSKWIISPLLDSLLFIGAPATVIVALLPLARYWSPQDYSFLLLAFFTFGHHLPGFLRAYGDRELFNRYRVRFLLAPPLMLAATLWLDVQGLHALIILVFTWDVWHVLMQHYGFMRIYDAKVGEVSQLTARMDWAVSISWYISLIAASPHYRHNLLLQSYQSGIPLLSGSVISGLRVSLYVLTGLLTVAYIVYSVVLWRRGHLNPRKLILLGTFLAASYYLYVGTKDFLTGFAVWSAFHCIQYYGIVWVYNQNRVARGSPMTAFARFLFRPRTGLVILYAALILAYGGINYLQKYTPGPDAYRLLLAFIATSNALHYYYDGFIWKVRDRQTQQYLGIPGEATPVRKALPKLAPSWDSGRSQAAYFAAAVVVLVLLETHRPNDELNMRQSLAAAAPEAEEAQLHLGDALRSQSRYAEALAAYREAVRLKPSYAEAHINMGVTLTALGQADQAVAAYRSALEISPDFPAAHFNLASLLANRGEISEALRHYQQALGGTDPDARRLALAAIQQLRAGQR